MKTLFIISTILISAACGGGSTTHNSSSASVNGRALQPVDHVDPEVPETPVVPKDGTYNGHGKVTRVSNDLGSIEIDHDDIPGVMPAMKMEFYVKDKSMLNGIFAGDEVNFVLEYKHPTETIVSIKRVK